MSSPDKMQIVKPGWAHTDEKGAKQSIYSIHVHPLGKRVATGSLDTKIKVWDAEVVLDETRSNEETLLCTMSTHNGAVLCVRWSNIDGRYLASGSDDQIILIWELDNVSRDTTSVFGSNEKNIENWKVVRRLTAHSSDVAGLSWSDDNRYLASCGFDSNIFIWDGRTFDRLMTLTAHNGFVKGLSWDPVGQYLASESDDRTVKIWRTSDWQVETNIQDPFVTSPTSTFFQRLSWSPDGSHIACANCQEGPVAVAAILRRTEWTTVVSLVGHQSPVEVVAFNPKLFKPSDESSTTGTICAVGSQDHCISIWSTNYARPLFATEQIFERSVLDLCWSPDGHTLFAASYDGSVCILRFFEGSFGTPVAQEEKERILEQYGYKRKDAIIIENTAQYTFEEQRNIEKKSNRISEIIEGPQTTSSFDSPTIISEPHQPPSTVPSVPPQLPSQSSIQLGQQQSPNKTNNPVITNAGSPTSPISNNTVMSETSPGTGTVSQPSGGVAVLAGGSTLESTSATATGVKNLSTPVQQTVTIMKDGKRRIQPQFLRGLSPPASQPMTTSSFPPITAPSSNLQASTNVFQPSQQHQERQQSSVEMSQPSSSLPPGGIPALFVGNKRHVADTESAQPSSKRMASAKGRLDTDSRTLRAANELPVVAMSQVRLGVPVVKEELKLELVNGIIECRNKDKVSKITCRRKGAVEWIDQVNSPILLIDHNDTYTTFSCEDGSVYIHSSGGRRIFPPIMLEAPASFMDSNDKYLLILTQIGLIYAWNIATQTSILSGVSLAPVLQVATLSSNEFTKTTIKAASITRNGVPLVLTSNDDTWLYHITMKSWMRVVNSSYTGPDFPPPTIPKWKLGLIGRAEEQSRTRRGVSQGQIYLENPGVGPRVLGHLETVLSAAKIIDSPSEFRQYLFLYVQQLTDAQQEVKLREVCKELLGPPGGQSTQNGWEPTLLGQSKHHLLRDVLEIISSNRALQRIVEEFDEALKRFSQPVPMEM